MERMQPPPNYYGAPYPPQVDPNTGKVNYPPNPNLPPEAPLPNGPAMPVAAPLAQVDDLEEYFSKIVRENVGRSVSVFCAFPDSTEWHDRIFKGNLASAGEDHIVLFDPNQNKYTLILGVYINYIEFFGDMKISKTNKK